MTEVCGFYEVDRRYGGPEEGGWWYDTGDLKRVTKVFKSEAAATRYCQRANHWLDVLINKHVRSPSSVLYSGGHIRCACFEDTAPRHYPEARPYYE